MQKVQKNSVKIRNMLTGFTTTTTRALLVTLTVMLTFQAEAAGEPDQELNQQFNQESGQQLDDSWQLPMAEDQLPLEHYKFDNGTLVAVYQRRKDGTYELLTRSTNLAGTQTRYESEASTDANGQVWFDYSPAKPENNQKPEEEEKEAKI